MNPINVSLLVFACAFGSALLGMLVKRLLPAHHVSSDSKDVVRVAMGMVATTVALVLGLLVYSAKSFYDTQTAEVTQLAANVVLLDRVLAHYGTESADIRAELQNSIQRHLEILWPEHASRNSNAQFATPGGEAILDKIHALTPKDDKQRTLQAQALTLALQIGQTRLLMLTQRSVPVPKLLLVMLVFWMMALFLSFGLFAPANLTVVVSLLVAAVAVCGAVFLMVEMYYPYGGLIQVSPAPLISALTQMGR
jgi:hypothetical protein